MTTPQLSHRVSDPFVIEIREGSFFCDTPQTAQQAHDSTCSVSYHISLTRWDPRHAANEGWEAKLQRGESAALHLALRTADLVEVVLHVIFGNFPSCFHSSPE